MTIDEIVKKAIPLSDCPVKRMGEINRRELLTKRICELIQTLGLSLPPENLNVSDAKK